MTTTDDEARTCELCNAPIPPARVKAIPGTWLCIDCSEEVGGDYVYINRGEDKGVKVGDRYSIVRADSEGR